MKTKLILKHRGDYDYFLLSRTKNSEAVQASLISDDEFEQKLSKQNCDEIFGVIDVDKLADEIIINHLTEGNPDGDFKKSTIGAEDKKNWFKIGFIKRDELNKDKLFTLGDIKEVIKKARLLARLKEDYGYDEYMFDEEDIIQSLQQPDEIEVEIVTRPFTNAYESHTVIGREPKLDENGCLILKKA